MLISNQIKKNQKQNKIFFVIFQNELIEQITSEIINELINNEIKNPRKAFNP